MNSTNVRVSITACLIVSMLCFINSADAQSRKRLRELEKMEESHEVDEAQAQEEGRARHMSIQSKRTRKEMKRYKKLNKRYNKNRKPLFRKRNKRK